MLDRQTGLLLTALAVVAIGTFAYSKYHQAPTSAAYGPSPPATIGQPQTPAASSPIDGSPTAPAGARSATNNAKRAVEVSKGDDLGRRLYRSKNFQPIVRDYAKLALDQKNGRAAWLVASALRMCSDAIGRAKRDPDFEQNFDLDYHKSFPNAPDWARVKARAEFDRCRNLAKEDPFSELPPVDDDRYHKSSYWSDLALSLHDPVAEVQRALTASGSATTDAQMSSATQQVQGAITHAAEAQDPAALYAGGWLLMTGKTPNDMLRGVGMALAACDLGYDCSVANLANSWSVCQYSGACPADADFAYYMQQSLGADRYGQAYAFAQSIEEAWANHDLAAFQQFVQQAGHGK